MKILKLANEHYKKRNYQEALSLYQKAGKIYGNKIVSHNIMLCERLTNNYAKKEIQACLNYEPKLTDSNLPEVTKYIQNSATHFNSLNIINAIELNSYPLVSIIMTSHNSAETIERSVSSLLHQTWPNLEIIIVDDYSSDRTMEILTELKKRSRKSIKIVGLNTNLGTYLSKNIGIQLSAGEIIMFQDSDDYSHPSRVSIQATTLASDPSLAANRTQYCRFDPKSEKIVPIEETLSKFGLITLAVRRSIFSEIGYFDAVRRAGDDEWFERLRFLYGTKKILNLPVTLYAAELRNNSLAADLMSIDNQGRIKQSISVERKQYLDIYKSRFLEKKDKAWFKENFTPLPKRAVSIYPNLIAALPYDTPPIYASICSIPQRKDLLKKVVERLLPQVDHIFVYLDKYPETPEFLNENPAITTWRSDDFDFDFRDNAKFIAYNYIKKKNEDFYYITCDDDIDYPADYVITLINNINLYDRKIVAGFHGVICEESPSSYFERRFTYHFIHADLHQPKLVNNLGTGTVGFHSMAFDQIDPKSWPTGGMVDIYFSIEARANKIPMVCLPRKSGWLTELAAPKGAPTLYQEFRKKEELITKNLARFSPWGYKSIIDTLKKIPPRQSSKLSLLLPFFSEEISIEQTFSRFRE